MIRYFCIVISFLVFALHADELYFTDFENFTVGDNQWVGTEDWLGTENQGGVSFIDNGAFGGSLGKTAGLGLSRPNGTRVSVLRVFNHDAAETGESIIEIETLISIRDSSNNRRDDFFLSIFNSSGGTPIASIRFDNESPQAVDSNFGIWREDGERQFDTRVNFVHEELYDLFIRIDLEANLWSADLGDLPLFINETFSNSVSGADLNFGLIGFEWQLAQSSSALHGDNFLFIGDVRVTAREKITEVQPVDIELRLNSNQRPLLTWESEIGRSYQVEYSSDLKIWKNDLANSLLSSGDSGEPLTFTDVTATQPELRYYRIITQP